MYNLTTMQRALALGAAGLALSASPALARPDYPLIVIGSGGSAPAATSSDLRSPDAVDASASPSIDLRSPDAADTSAAKPASVASVTPSQQTPAAVVAVSSDDGFDWASAAIGAGVIVALGLLAAGGVAMTHRTRMHPTP
jgi:hypothetical protein